MVEHSPHHVAGYLRDYLATHDKPLVFLFGAGTSASVKILDSATDGQKPLVPPILPLTEICRAEVGSLGDREAAAWDALCDECSAIEEAPNVENILSRVRAKASAMGGEDTSCGLTRKAIKEVELKIAETIIREASPAEDTIPNECPHDVFARWIARTSRRNPIEVFTTNYDILVERSLENARVPVFDGFIGSHKPFFAPEVVEDNDLMPPVDWVRVWKLHGSINWGLTTSSGKPRIIRTGKGDPQLILPSQLKYVESRKEPYLALIDRLSKALRLDGSVLISIGYSFGDQHLNNIIFEALDSNPLTHLVCLAYEPLCKYPGLVEHAKIRRNIILIARNGAIVGGQTGGWSKSEATSIFTGKTETDSGAMLLGDFNVFARFLSEMDPSISATNE